MAQFPPRRLPTIVLNDLDQIDCLDKLERFEAAFYFGFLELGGLVDHHACRRATAMSPAIEIQRTGNDPEHFRIG